jgi:hypothetical protein
VRSSGGIGIPDLAARMRKGRKKKRTPEKNFTEGIPR